MWLAFSQFLFYRGGLELNSQYLQGIPVLQRDGNEKASKYSIEDSASKIIYNQNQKTFNIETF